MEKETNNTNADENQKENRQLAERQMKMLEYTLNYIIKARKVSRPSDFSSILSIKKVNLTIKYYFK